MGVQMIEADEMMKERRPRPEGATVLLERVLAGLRARAEASPAAANADDPQTDAKDMAEASLGDVIDSLDERAFGILFLLLALPCCLPFVYILPQIVALPMLALAGQMAMGRRHPWLPRSMRERRFRIAAFEGVLARARKYLGWIEAIARPRLRPVTGHGAARLIGVVLLVPTASILLPLPSTNTVPGIGVAIAALGLIERDGLLVIGGLVIGFLWVGLLLFVGAEAASIIKDWLAARFA